MKSLLCTGVCLCLSVKGGTVENDFSIVITTPLTEAINSGFSEYSIHDTGTGKHSPLKYSEITLGSSRLFEPP